MAHIYIINTHVAYSSSPGRLNRSLVEHMESYWKKQGHEVRVTYIDEGWDVDTEVDQHVWADLVVLQIPVNWMGVPWKFKKYQDEVYTAGLDGRLAVGDGRSRADDSKQYGSGGVLQGKKYFLSLTFNAPQEAFNDRKQLFFEGKSEDDLFFPVHLNFRFFGMEALPTFVCYDVVKNPNTAEDFHRLEGHLDNLLLES